VFLFSELFQNSVRTRESVDDDVPASFSLEAIHLLLGQSCFRELLHHVKRLLKSFPFDVLLPREVYVS
jgi:hypothetical protein